MNSYQRDPKRRKELYNKHYRERRVFLKSRRSILIENKPAFPDDGRCMLCGKEHKLYYHHWTDEHPEWGIWVCFLCHTLAEKTDKDLDRKYREFKSQLG